MTQTNITTAGIDTSKLKLDIAVNGRTERWQVAAALPAAFRWNKALVALYARLTAAGKSHKAALIACARKLLIYANTVVQRGTPWIEKAA